MNRVCSERNLKGWTQADLAREVGVNESTVVRWEAGGNIPQDKMVKLRSIFGCDLDWLIGLTNERKTVA